MSCITGSSESCEDSQCCLALEEYGLTNLLGGYGESKTGEEIRDADQGQEACL